MQVIRDTMRCALPVEVAYHGESEADNDAIAILKVGAVPRVAADCSKEQCLQGPTSPNSASFCYPSFARAA